MGNGERPVATSKVDSAYVDRRTPPIEASVGSAAEKMVFPARPPKAKGSGEPLPNLPAPKEDEGESDWVESPLAKESKADVRNERAGTG